MDMPSFNIFIISAPPEVKKEEKKERKLTRALRQKKDTGDAMVNKLSEISDKLRRLPLTSHVGGG